jgi:hypothetical protein
VHGTSREAMLNPSHGVEHSTWSFVVRPQGFHRSFGLGIPRILSLADIDLDWGTNNILGRSLSRKIRRFE